MKWFNWLLGNWIAFHIDRALLHPSYCGQRHQYLCMVLSQELRGIGPMVAQWYIRSCIGHHHTLHTFLKELTGPRFPDRWAEREVYHRRFYIYLCIHLRQGDLEWGRNLTGYDLHLDDLMDVRIDETA